jgi:hypothetical protein
LIEQNTWRFIRSFVGFGLYRHLIELRHLLTEWLASDKEFIDLAKRDR